MAVTKGASTMERIDVPGVVAGLGAGSDCIRLAHSSTRLERGLEPGEVIALADASGGVREATVVDVEFELDDTAYVLSLGVQVRDPDAGPGTATPLSVQSVVDLLNDLRDERRGGAR